MHRCRWCAPLFSYPDRLSSVFYAQGEKANFEHFHLENQHAVAIRIETIFFGDSLAVGFESEVAASEGGDEHDEGGFWEVEIC